MYNEYFGFKETPFSIAPDPRYLFMSEQHREALAHLLFGINSDGGFVLLTGEVGTGKTTICRCVLEQLPENCVVAFILNPKLSVLELLSTICDEFRIPYAEGATSVKVFVDKINAYLLDANARGLKAVLIIDEAQNLSTDVLEQMRLLTNLETNQRKLLQIILIGQPELRILLARPELRQLAQRIIARYHLGPLTKKDMSAYVNHRLAVAGMRNELFSDSVFDRLYRMSGGIPRLINLLCDRSLLGTYAQNKKRVDKKTLKRAAREVFGEMEAEGGFHRKKLHRAYIGLGILAAGFLAGGAFYYYKPFYDHKLPDLKAHVVQVPEVVESPKGAEPPKALDPPDDKSPDAKTREVPVTAPAPEPENVIASPAYRRPMPSLTTSQEPEQRSNSSAAVAPGNATTEKVNSGSLESWADRPHVYNQSSAYESLFKLWKITFRRDAGGDDCRQAESQGLQCFSAAGGLDELSKLNRPAVLKLHNKNGQAFYATLSSLNGREATLSSSGETLSVGIAEIAQWWRGDYTLLWKPPPGYERVLQGGYQGPVVGWVRSRLANLQGKPIQPLGKIDVFDKTLTEQVKKFQIAHGLKPDGLVGPQTLIRINTALGQGIPLLWGNKKDGR
ncbi:ExeA family protein [Desulforhabdus amnigena]|uniref:ATPase AAA n=1 Tax=Desulforhabdus amnigena TaxID=40218 RepID=A0A9W6LAT7_9BACT|nr:AAA family ATPase [Desulforhabdus amnigena]GLI36330.1 ATPase AAA [Desulforhabdus amnigena]